MKFSEYKYDSVLRKELNRTLQYLAKNVIISDRTSVAVGPTGRETTNTELGFKIPARSQREILLWILLSYYINSEYSTFVREMLQEKYIVRISNLQIREMSLLALEDQDNAIALFLAQFRKREELFGYILQERILKIEIFYRLRRDLNVFVPKKSSRHRGYRDKGSLGDGLHLDQEYHKDVWLAEVEEMYLKNQKKSRDLSSLIYEIGLFD